MSDDTPKKKRRFSLTVVFPQPQSELQNCWREKVVGVEFPWTCFRLSSRSGLTSGCNHVSPLLLLSFLFLELSSFLQSISQALRGGSTTQCTKYPGQKGCWAGCQCKVLFHSEALL